MLESLRPPSRPIDTHHRETNYRNDNARSISRRSPAIVDLACGRAASTFAVALCCLAAVPARSQTFVDDGQTRRVSIWAAKGLMQNPVSFCFDPQGNIYVAETDRAGNAVADTRWMEHLNAVEEDLQMKTVDDRRAQIKKWLDNGLADPDFFTRTEDRVRIVRDRDGDGKADWSGVYAGKFNDTVDGIGAGVLWLDGTVFYTCIPHVWALRSTSDPDVADVRESLSYGYGVRWCFFGHDLHGIMQGPDGRLYYSMGDRGYNLTTKEGVRYIGPDRGAVFRCWPDGSGLELFHDGLRNPQELAFDEFGELYTGDNNCDSGDLARFVHVLEGADSGWRQDVQSLETRGPWNREFLWHTIEQTSGIARPAWSIPPIAHVGAGPAGMALYPGTGESDLYDGWIFMVDFYGSGSTIHAVKPQPRGAWSQLTDRVEYYKGVTVTDIAWGTDGRLYMSDWGGGWTPNPNGEILTIRNETLHADASKAASIREVRNLITAGFASAPEDQLLLNLAHWDSRVRLGAQHEYAKRATAHTRQGRSDPARAEQATRSIDAIATIAGAATSDARARRHAIWCLGEIARVSPDAADALATLLTDADAEIRAQAAKTLGDVGGDASRRSASVYLAMLKDPAPRARYYAALALGKARHAPAVGPLLAMLADNDNTDLAIRHAGAFALSLIGDADALVSAAKQTPAPARLGALLALRKMNNPAASNFLDDPDPVIAVEAARAIYDLRLAQGMKALAAKIEGPIDPALAIEPFMRRAIEANVLLGTDDCVMRLAAFAARTDVAPDWRHLALERVARWDEPLKREGVWGNWVNFPGRSREALEKAAATHIVAIIESAGASEKISTLALEVQAEHALTLNESEVLARIADVARTPQYRRILLEQVGKRYPARLADAAESVLVSGATGDLKWSSLELLAGSDPVRAIRRLEEDADQGPISERQRAVRLIGSIAEKGSAEARSSLTDRIGRVGSGMIDRALALELYDAAMKLPADSAARRAAQGFGTQAPRPEGFSTFLLASGGNADRGKHIFSYRVAAGCVRCHEVDGVGGSAGPKLNGVGDRLSRELIVESLVEPTKVVAPGFGEISAMPSVTAVLTPEETRDVVAYLLTLRTPKKETPDNTSTAAAHAQTGDSSGHGSGSDAASHSAEDSSHSTTDAGHASVATTSGKSRSPDGATATRRAEPQSPFGLGHLLALAGAAGVLIFASRGMIRRQP